MRYKMLMVLLGGVPILVYGAGAEFTVFQRNKAFSMRQIAMQVGDQITFRNEDNVNHSLYSEAKGTQFDVLQGPGESFTVRFLQPGTIEVRCAIHPSMTLEVQVRQ